MKVSITKEEIYKNVAALTAMVGRMTGDGANVTVSADNYPMLNIYVTSGVGELEGELARRLKSSNSLSLKDTSTAVSVEFITDKVRMNKAVLNTITLNLKLYLAHYVTASWLAARETAKAISDSYKESAAGFLQTISTLLLLREEYVVDAEDYQARSDEDSRMDKTATGDTYDERVTEQVIGEDEVTTAYDARNADESRMNEAATGDTYDERVTEQVIGEDEVTTAYDARNADESRMNEAATGDTYDERVTEQVIGEDEVTTAYDARNADESRMDEAATAINYDGRTTEGLTREGDSGATYSLREEDTLDKGKDVPSSVDYDIRKRDNRRVVRKDPLDIYRLPTHRRNNFYH